MVLNNMNNQLTQNQYNSLIINSFVGIGILSLAYETSKVAKQDAWISVLISGVIPLLILFNSSYLHKKHGNMTFTNSLINIYGKFLGNVVIILFILNSILVQFITLSTYVEIVKYTIVDFLPNWLIAVSVILTTILTSYNGISGLGRFTEINTPFILIIFFIPLIYITKGSFSNISPIATNMINILYATPNAMLAYQGGENAYFFQPYISKEKELFLENIKCLLLLMFIYTVVVFVTIYYLGYELTSKYKYSLLFLVKLVELPILSDLRSTFLLIWSSSILITLAINHYTFSNMLENIFTLNRKRTYIINYIIIISLYLTSESNRAITMFIYDTLFPIVFFSILFISTLSTIILIFKKEDKYHARQ